MSTKADQATFENVFNELGIKYKKSHLLQHPKLPVRIYYNRNKAGSVYFTTYKTYKNKFPTDLWEEIPSTEIKKKDQKDNNLNIFPKASKIKEAFEKLFSEPAIFINGFSENTISEIISYQQRDFLPVCYLCPCCANQITLLKNWNPSTTNPIDLYLSISNDLKNIYYTASIVGWENKTEISAKKRTLLGQHMNNFQPIMEDAFKKDKFLNLISVRNMKKLQMPLEASNLITWNDNTKLGEMPMSGGFAYVPKIDFTYESTSDSEILERRVQNILKTGIKSKPAGCVHPDQQNISTKLYKRNPAVAAWVLQEAKGSCKLCRENGPFKKEDGCYYLEVHHILPLTENGADTVDNAIALCPNCHRKCHYSPEKEILKKSLAQINDDTNV